MANLVVSDIDGVISNCEHRLSWAKAKLYDEFYSRVGMDEPIMDGINLIKRLTSDDGARGDMLIFLTGRREDCREETIEWLKKFDLEYDSLYMRQEGDHRPANELKKELYAEIVRMCNNRGLSFEHVFFIDDDSRNVQAICEGDDNVTGLTFGIKRMEGDNVSAN